MMSFGSFVDWIAFVFIDEVTYFWASSVMRCGHFGMRHRSSLKSLFLMELIEWQYLHLISISPSTRMPLKNSFLQVSQRYSLKATPIVIFHWPQYVVVMYYSIPQYIVAHRDMWITSVLCIADWLSARKAWNSSLVYELQTPSCSRRGRCPLWFKEHPRQEYQASYGKAAHGLGHWSCESFKIYDQARPLNG